MMEIKMQSRIYEVVEVKKKTKAAMFKNLKTGSKIQLNTKAERVGVKSSGSYAAIIVVENVITKEKVNKTFNELPPLLSNFVLEEGDDFEWMA